MVNTDVDGETIEGKYKMKTWRSDLRSMLSQKNEGDDMRKIEELPGYES